MARLYEIIRSPLVPLTDDALWSEWQQWFDLLFKYMENTVLRSATSGDAVATLLANQGYHGVTALSAPRTLTLPDAEGLEDGHMVIIQDESGAAGTHTITVAAGTSDTLNGASTITANYGRLTVIKRGSNDWYGA